MGRQAEFLKKYRAILSSRQVRILQSAQNPERRSANASSPRVGKAMQPARPIAMPTSSAPERPRLNVQSNQYNELYAAAHGPRSWPAPKPFFFGSTGQHKYRQVKASTLNRSYSLGALEYMLIAVDAYSQNAPLIAWTTTSDGTVGLPCTTLNLSPSEAIIDRGASGIYIPTTSATYADHNPVSYFDDPGAVKSGAFYWSPTENVHPVATQLQAASVHVKVMTPYGGSAVAYTVAPGDAPSFIGRHTQMVRANTSGPVHDDLDCHLRVPYHGSSSATPITLAETYGVPTAIPGNNTVDLAFCSQAHTGWTFTGTQDATDAPDTNTYCRDRGFMPRANFVPRMGDGYVLIQNTSSTDACTVIFSGRFTFAYVVNPDDGSRSLGALASVLARDSQTLERHTAMPDARSSAMPSISGTLESVRNKLSSAIHSVTGSAEAAADAAKSFASKHQTAIELGAAGAVAAHGAISAATGGTGNIFTRAFARFMEPLEHGAVMARNAFRGAGTAARGAIRRMPIVEEVFEGAEAAAIAAEPFAPLLLM